MIDKTKRFIRGAYNGLMHLGITVASVLGLVFFFKTITAGELPVFMRVFFGIAAIFLVLLHVIANVIKDADNVD